MNTQRRHERRLERWLKKAPKGISYNRIETSLIDYHRKYQTTEFLAFFLEEYHKKKN